MSGAGFNWAQFFLLVLRASFFSTGGFGNLPALHADLVESRGWTTESAFTESLAVGQISPGPNGLWAVCLGFRIDGLRGGMVALVAICLPPLLVLAVAKLHARVADNPAVQGFLLGLGASVIGIFAVTLARLLWGIGITSVSGAICVCAFVLASTKRIPVTVILFAAAVAGICLHQMG